MGRQHRRFEIIDGEIVSNSERKQVDDFVGMRPDDVRAENAAHLHPQESCSRKQARKRGGPYPVGRPRGLDLQFRGMRTGGAFGKAPQRLPVVV